MIVSYCLLAQHLPNISRRQRVISVQKANKNKQQVSFAAGVLPFNCALLCSAGLLGSVRL